MKDVPASSVLPYYIAAPCFFLFAQAVLCSTALDVQSHFFQPKLLAFTHLMAIGWATLIIFGASNQIVPVISELPLKSRSIPKLVLSLLCLGVAMLSFSFYSFQLDYMIIAGAALVFTGMLIHSLHIIRSCGDKKIIQLEFIKTAHIWLLTTAALGLLLLINLRWPFLPEDHVSYLKLHAGIGMSGWFLLLVIGVASKLIPMFLITDYNNPRLLRSIFLSLNLGLIIFILNGFLINSEGVRILSFVLIFLAVPAFIYYISRCLAGRARKKMEPAMRQSMLAIFLAVLPFILLFIAWLLPGQKGISLLTATGFSFFSGFLSILIMNQTFKTLPFVVWMHSTAIKSSSGILPKDMFREMFMQIHNYTYACGFFIFLAGLIFKLQALLIPSALLMTLGAGLYFAHVIYVSTKIMK